MGIKKIIAIASAKGGVGKSSICANLAYTFSQKYNVGILDADIYGPNQHIIFKVPLSKPELVEKGGKKKFLPVKTEDIVINSMGFILEADKAAMWRGPMLSGAIKQLMESTEWGDLDYLFIDMPPGTGDAYLTVAKDLKPDSVILVTTNSPLAIQDTLKSKIVFQKLGIPIIGYVNNMALPINDNNNEKIDQTSELKLNYLGAIPVNEDIVNFNFSRATKLFESIYNNLKNII